MCFNRLLAVSIALSLLSIPAAGRAVIVTFTISDDAEFAFPFLGIGPLAAPGAVEGTTVIDDTGNQTPTLNSLQIRVQWADTVSGGLLDDVTGVPGSSIEIDLDTTIGPLPNQTGAGSVSTLIHWGPLSGWVQSGEFSCVTICPGGCFQTVCDLVYGFEGTGPPPPLTSSSYNLDPWTFSGGGASFDGPIAGQRLWLIPGSVLFTGDVWLSGVRTAVPALGGWGASALAGVLLFAGYWQMVRKRG
jgi:hypothetical protein